MRKTAIGLLALGAIGLGCNKSEEAAAPAPAAPAAPAPAAPAPATAPAAGGEAEGADGYKVVEVANGGTIAGAVKWTGAAPKLDDLKVTKDPGTCGKAKKNPRLVVGKGGGVANTYVYLADIKAGAKIEPKDGLIDQKTCEYSPHAQVVPVGSKIVAQNSDPILHNVHSYLGTTTVFNFAQPIQGQKSEQKLTKVGTVTAKCDAGHIWMNAIVHVTNNPYYALTSDDGKFEIKNVPPGKYQIVAWHEGWKTTQSPTSVSFSDPVEQKKDVTVEAGKPAAVDFTLSAN